MHAGHFQCTHMRGWLPSASSTASGRLWTAHFVDDFSLTRGPGQKGFTMGERGRGGGMCNVIRPEAPTCTVGGKKGNPSLAKLQRPPPTSISTCQIGFALIQFSRMTNMRNC